MRRIAALAGLLATAALALASPAAAAPLPAGGFDLYGTYDWSNHAFPVGLKSTGSAPANAFEDAAVPGVGRARPVLRNHIGNHVVLSATHPAAGDWWAPAPMEAWSLSLMVSLDEVSGSRPLARPVEGAAALQVVDGFLTWSGGGLVVRDRATPIAPASWHHVVLTRSAGGAAAVYLDGVRELTFADPDGTARVRRELALFSALAGGTVGGRLARVRLWDSALSATDAASLEAMDVTPPTFQITRPSDGGGVYPSSPYLAGRAEDDVADAADVAIVVRDEAGHVVHARPPMSTPIYSNIPDWSVGIPAAAVVEDRHYVAAITLSDPSGNAAPTQYRRFVPDGRRPDPTLRGTPAVTSDRHPLITGDGGSGLGDMPNVSIRVHRLGGYKFEPEFVMSIPVRDGRFSGRTPIPLELGPYQLYASQEDWLGRGETDVEPLQIVEPAAEAAALAAAGGTASSQPAGAVSATRLRAAVVSRLRASRLRRLLRGTERTAFRADRPGAASVRVTSGGRTVFTARRTTSVKGIVRMTIKPARRARAILRGKRRARLTTRATFRPRVGAAASQTARLTVRR